jgi:hypothetical protein
MNLTDDLEKRWATEAPEVSYKYWLAERVIKLESVVTEIRDHLYTKQDMDRIRGMAKEVLPK